jgi:hypothetical protein
MRLRDYPYIVVRFACRHCPRIGRYRVAVLAERYGADIEMEDLLEAVSASCGTRASERAHACGAYFPDLPPEKPPDLPRAVAAGTAQADPGRTRVILMPSTTKKEMIGDHFNLK